MVPHFFPGMPLPGGTHTVTGGVCVPSSAEDPHTHPLETAGAGLLPRACVVTVPILLGHMGRGDGGDTPQKKQTPPHHGETEAGAGGRT